MALVDSQVTARFPTTSSSGLKARLLARSIAYEAIEAQSPNTAEVDKACWTSLGSSSGEEDLNFSHGSQYLARVSVPPYRYDHMRVSGLISSCLKMYCLDGNGQISCVLIVALFPVT
jgi:hypothetical protein